MSIFRSFEVQHSMQLIALKSDCRTLGGHLKLHSACDGRFIFTCIHSRGFFAFTRTKEEPAY